MFADVIPGVIRTFVPALVGSFVAWLFGLGVQIDSDSEKALSAAVVAIVIAVYYTLVTLLERRISPSFGWLLGLAKAPAYSKRSAPAPASQVVGGTEYDDRSGV